MRFRSKHISPSVTDDIDEARALRQSADDEFQKLKGQEPLVRSLTQALINRRVTNHFGDDLTITFNRRLP